MHLAKGFLLFDQSVRMMFLGPEISMCLQITQSESLEGLNRLIRWIDHGVMRR